MDAPTKFSYSNPDIVYDQNTILKELGVDNGICMSLIMNFCFQYLFTSVTNSPTDEIIHTILTGMKKNEKCQLVYFHKVYMDMFTHKHPTDIKSEIEIFLKMYELIDIIKITYTNSIEDISKFKDINTIMTSIVSGSVCFIGCSISDESHHAMAIFFNKFDNDIWFFDPSNGFFKIPLDQNSLYDFLCSYSKSLKAVFWDIAILSL